MKERPFRPVARGLAFGAWLALVGCGDDGVRKPPAEDGAQSTTNGPPAAPPSPNFRLLLGERYRSEVGTASARNTEAFLEAALAPLERLPGLLPRTVSVVYDRCDRADAFHDGTADTITLCHELAEYALELFESASTSQDPEERGDLASLQARSAVAFVLYHEIAHALDFQLELPVVGNLESAMDSIATVIAVETGQPLHSIAGAALVGHEPPSLADGHGDGVDRGGDIVCWTVGGDETARAQLLAPTVSDVFATVGRDCEAEYAALRDTVRAWLPGLARLEPEGVAEPSADAALRFVPGPTWLQQEGADPATRRRVERLFADLFAPLGAAAGLPGPIDVVYEICGEARSSYAVATRTLTLCRELVDHAYRYGVDLIDATTASEFAFAWSHAYDYLGFALYHELGHALDGSDAYGLESVELESDALAAVLLVESGNGVTVLDAALILAGDPPPAQRALHGGSGTEVGSRFDELLCLMIGGDAALRTSPQLAELAARYAGEERDCVARYAERREEVRARLAGD